MATQEPGKTQYVAQGEALAEPVPLKKQGHKCCGGCCDMRRATIIVNIINISLTALGLLAVAGASKMVEHYEEEAEDEEWIASTDNLSLWLLVTLSFVRIVCNGLGIYGAIKYNIWLVGISLVMYLVDMVVGMVSFGLVGVLYDALFAYPHVLFIREVRRGIMTPENYKAVEEQSCCCV